MTLYARFALILTPLLLAASLLTTGAHARDTGIEAFRENIYLTSSNTDTGLLAFLERNEGKIVFIDNLIDTSMSIEENAIVQEQCGVDIDAVTAREIDDFPLLLPTYDSLDELVCGPHFLVLDLGERTTWEYGSGGTGIVTVRFRGFFELISTGHSGPSIYYHLKEVDVPFGIRQQFYQN